MPGKRASWLRRASWGLRFLLGAALPQPDAPLRPWDPRRVLPRFLVRWLRRLCRAEWGSSQEPALAMQAEADAARAEAHLLHAGVPEASAARARAELAASYTRALEAPLARLPPGVRVTQLEALAPGGERRVRLGSAQPPATRPPPELISLLERHAQGLGEDPLGTLDLPATEWLERAKRDV